jgi:hypothetical protein
MVYFFLKILHIPGWLESARFLFVVLTLRYRATPVYKLGEILTHHCIRFQDCSQDQLRRRQKQWLNTWYVQLSEYSSLHSHLRIIDL